MRKKNRTFRFLLSFVLVISTVTAGIMPVSMAAASFTDVPSDAYYAESVDWAVENNITKGTSDTTFSPDDGCTRAQCMTFLYRYAGSPKVDAGKASKFTDVKSDEYYADAVAWAVGQNITTGTSDTTFSPGDQCTRAQIVTFLWRYNSTPSAENTGSFVDVKGDAYYAGAVSWAVEKEITKGTSDTTFSPDNPCTRAQIVTFLFRTSKAEQDRLQDEMINYGDLQVCVEDGTAEVTLNNNGKVESIIGRFTDHKVTDEVSAADLLNASSALLGEGFQIDETQIQCEVQNQNTEQEESFYRTKSRINNVPVLGSEIILTTDSRDHVTGLFSTYNEAVEEVYTDPELEEEEAVQLAIAAVAGQEGLEESDLEGFSNTLNCDSMLAIYARNVDKPFLVYEVQVHSRYSNTDSSDQIDEIDLDSLETPTESEDNLVSFPAVNYTVEVAAGGEDYGSIYLCINNTQDGFLQWTHTTETLRDFHGSSTSCKIQMLNVIDLSGRKYYRLRDGDRNVEVRENVDDDSQGSVVMKTNTSDFRTASVSLYKNMITVYDYYKNKMGRDSFDGNGKRVIATLTTGNYNNACWDPGQESFFFGRFENQEYGAALDIVGHEFTHAVVNYAVGPNGINDTLEYQGETGALNEAYADIMGSFIEGKNGNDRWNHGEDSGGIDRSFSNPSLYDDADHYRAVTESKIKGTEWYEKLEEYVNRDNEGVHFFSGIINHAAYLMMTDSRTSSVSKDSWAKVFYHSLYRLQTDSLFVNHRAAVIAAARQSGFTSSQLQAIRDAFDKVGIVGKYWKVNPQPGTVDLDSANVGDYVIFGHYEQDNNLDNGNEPIVWKVLDKKKDRALLLSKYILDNQLYNKESEVVPWETCTLRNWLNSTFLNEAFTEIEKAYIPTVTLSNPDNPTFGTAGGNDTQDQIFLLSLQEIQQYFTLSDIWSDYDGNTNDVTQDSWYLGGSKEVITSPTAYAAAQGAYTYPFYHDAEGRESHSWWLRSPGCDTNYCADVTSGGDVSAHGDFYVYFDSNGVRPALWVDLES